MSVANITRIEPVLLLGLPIAVKVTFRQRQGGSRVYLYDSIRAAISILKGEDPAQWSGVLISETSATEDTAGRISDIVEGVAGDIAAGAGEVAAEVTAEGAAGIVAETL